MSNDNHDQTTNRVWFFSSHPCFRLDEDLTVGSEYENWGIEQEGHRFKRGLTATEALSAAYGAIGDTDELGFEPEQRAGEIFAVQAELSAGEAVVAGQARYLTVLQKIPAADLLFKFAFLCADRAIKRQSEFGYYSVADASRRAVQGRRRWLAGALSEEELTAFHRMAAAVPVAYNGAMPATPYWSYYEKDKEAVAAVAACAAAVAAPSVTVQLRSRRMLSTDVDKRVNLVAQLAQRFAFASGVCQAWKCRAGNIGSPPAHFWNAGLSQGLGSGRVISEYVRLVEAEQKGQDIFARADAMGRAALNLEVATQNAELLGLLQSQRSV